jgi:CheY-like chemotaxis protein
MSLRDIKPRSILLVDPFPDEARMYTEFLQAEGFRVLRCWSARAALKRALYNPPELVLTRLRQVDPSFTGVEFTASLKADERLCGVPVVIVTTSIRPEDEKAALASGCASFIRLPCPLEQLIHEVRRVIELWPRPPKTLHPAPRTRSRAATRPGRARRAKPR